MAPAAAKSASPLKGELPIALIPFGRGGRSAGGPEDPDEDVPTQAPFTKNKG